VLDQAQDSEKDEDEEKAGGSFLQSIRKAL